jgi:hypothetical protein
MNKYLSRKNLIIFSIGIILLGTLILLPMSYRPIPITIEATTPLDKSTQNSVMINPQIQFNKSILASDISIASSPDENWTINQVDKQTISLSHKKYLYLNTKYVLTIKYLDQVVSIYTFSTAPGQTDPRFLQQVQDKMDAQYPLMGETPRFTQGYSLVYSAPLTLEITILDSKITPSDIILQAKAWVTQNGLAPDSHQYKIAQPATKK